MSAVQAPPPEHDPAGGLDISQIVDLLADAALPLEVGHFEVDRHGLLVRRAADRQLAFTFDYGGFSFDCAVRPGSDGRISLAAALGALPYTAESPWARTFVLRLLSRGAALPSGRLELAEDGTVRLAASKPAPLPCTASGVMAAVTAMLLEFRPWAEALHHTLGPPLAA